MSPPRPADQPYRASFYSVSFPAAIERAEQMLAGTEGPGVSRIIQDEVEDCARALCEWRLAGTQAPGPDPPQVYVIAGSPHEAEQWAREFYVQPGEWCFVTRPDTLRGLASPAVVLVGAYAARNDWDELLVALLASRAVVHTWQIATVASAGADLWFNSAGHVLALETYGAAWRRVTAALETPPGPPPPDAAVDELVDLARQGDRAGFRELASCLMPLEEIDDCWTGARRRLGLPAD